MTDFFLYVKDEDKKSYVIKIKKYLDKCNTVSDTESILILLRGLSKVEAGEKAGLKQANTVLPCLCGFMYGL